MTNQLFRQMPVIAFESRRANEMASLIGRYGGIPVQAPALREVRPEHNPHAVTFAEALSAGSFDYVVFLTGVGTRALTEEVGPLFTREQFASALGKTAVVARGPKPTSALRELGVSHFHAVPSPNTFAEVLAELDRLAGERGLAGARIAVQEYGGPASELHVGLLARGVHITSVPVYTWALPEDTTPLRNALRMLADRRAQIALFTTRAQIENVFEIAAEEALTEAVREALASGVVASVGPVCSAALVAEGFPPDVEPSVFKMGQLVKETAERWEEILLRKKGAERSQ
ncbi:MAG: uroporphyrinogen-III synthase [Polyangiaceae bacterium]|nr:uroporphyrinogen-III synthase [Polyangiaceae bacterium]